MSKAAEAYKFIQDSISSGKTVYVSTAMRVTKVTPKTAKSWKESGHDLFKLADDVLFMASGKSFVRLIERDIVLVGIQAA